MCIQWCSLHIVYILVVIRCWRERSSCECVRRLLTCLCSYCCFDQEYNILLLQAEATWWKEKGLWASFVEIFRFQIWSVATLVIKVNLLNTRRLLLFYELFSLNDWSVLCSVVLMLFWPRVFDIDSSFIIPFGDAAWQDMLPDLQYFCDF